MARVIIIGGIESTYENAQVLANLGEEIVMFFTRGAQSPGWEGVAMVDESRFPFAAQVPRTIVNGNINEHVGLMRELHCDFIYSLGWQQIYKPDLMSVCPVIGIHESLLPEGAGAVPIANAILHERPLTGVTLFELDGGVDTGPIIGQLRGLLDPRTATATALYREAMQLERSLLEMFVPHLNRKTAPRISQDLTKRTVYKKVDWSAWPDEVVGRARTYPYA